VLSIADFVAKLQEEVRTRALASLI